MLPCTSPEIFTLRKDYTVVEGVDATNGKWPNSLGNGWFTDSEYLIDDLIDMIVDNVPKKSADLDDDLANSMEELGAMLKAKSFGDVI